MKKLILLLLIQFALISLSHSQYNPVDSTSYIFQLNTTEARQLSENYYGLYGLNETYFHTLVDSFDYGQTPLTPISYPSGHYLIAKATGQEVQVSFASVNTISAVILPNKRDLLIQVYDSTGQQITNAKIQIANKEIPYNARKGGYFKTKWKKEGLVEITTTNETLFYQLQKKNRNWKLIKERYRYFSTSKLGRILTIPFRAGKRTYFTVRGALNNHGVIVSYFRNFGNRWQRKLQYKGYVALNQPVYQPRDTVKVKAYVTNRKGKPLKRELHLQLTSPQNGHQNYFDIPVHPDKHGNYLYEFTLGDSLKLDQTFSLTFYDKKRFRKNQFTQMR